MESIKYSVLFVIILLFSACQQEHELNWMNWEKAEILANEHKDKKVLVWIYDEGCDSCVKAEIKNFSDSSINKYINENYYCIKFEGHHPDPITTKGNIYRVRGDGIHELAIALTRSEENIGFPKIAFLNEQMSLIVPITGTLEKEDLKYLLAFVAENAYEKMSIDEYKKQHKPDF